MHTGKLVRGANGQRQEPDDGRLSRPVPWERRGEVPLRDPITPYWWAGCTVIFSIAEAILLPNLSILLDRLAPERYRGAYLGTSTLVVLGLSLGPFVGGALLEWSGKGVFVMMALFCLCIAVLMLINKQKIKLRLRE
ncbi:MFS transporter [Xenorhabdus nematophila]|uniref:MFS transporter n=1 Tax=Xenorhabdus nematophila TaxID=628 RepID=UPI000540947E|nr:MFS transporter [Xenorhabdus nematophila]CEK25406.1 conserved membrane protein of unknown function [Xenorhabdus nematophila AN6/1]